MLLTFPGRSIGTAGVSVGSGSSVGIGVSVGSGSTVGIGVSIGSTVGIGVSIGSTVGIDVSTGSEDGSLVAAGVSVESADGSSVSADALTNAFVDTVHCEFLLTAAYPVTPSLHTNVAHRSIHSALFHLILFIVAFLSSYAVFSFLIVAQIIL